MNIKYISENYDLSVFVDKVNPNLIVDWHYGTDFDDVDEDYWERKWTPEAGNANIFKDAMRAIKNGCDELPNIYLSETVDERHRSSGPTLLLIEWPILDRGFDTPGHLYSVHTANEGGLVPPLPSILAEQFSKAVTKNNNE